MRMINNWMTKEELFKYSLYMYWHWLSHCELQAAFRGTSSHSSGAHTVAVFTLWQERPREPTVLGGKQHMI